MVNSGLKTMGGALLNGAGLAIAGFFVPALWTPIAIGGVVVGASVAYLGASYAIVNGVRTIRHIRASIDER